MMLRLATRQDIEAIAMILAEAFKEEELHAHMFPGRKRWPEDYVRCWRDCVWERWWDYSRVWVVAVEESTQNLECHEQKPHSGPNERVREPRLLGVAEWRKAGRGWEMLWGSLPVLDPRNVIQYAVKGMHHWQNWRAPNRSIRQPSSADPSPINKLNFGSRIGPFMQGLFPHDTYWELCTLAVDPDSRLGGVGKALVNWGLNRAKEEGVPAAVVCAKDTESFYLKCGFSVGSGVASEVKVDDLVNPLSERGLGGGTVLWTHSDRAQMEEPDPAQMSSSP